MSAKRKELPESFVEPATGEVFRRGIRPMTVTYKGESITVDVPGYYPDGGSDDHGVLVGDDMIATDEALRILKIRLGEIDAEDGATEPSRLAS